MNRTIIGLMIKDLLQLKTYTKSLLFFCVIFLASSLLQKNTNIAPFLLCFMLTFGFGLFSSATFSYDESSKSEKFILSLPISKKQIVLSKYLLIFCSTLVGNILGIILALICSPLFAEKLVLKQLFEYALGGLAAVSLIHTIQVPFIFKFGVEKGRYQLFIVIALLSLLGGGISMLFQKFHFSFVLTGTMETILKSLLPFLAFGALFLLYFISYKISVKVYTKKEF